MVESQALVPGDITLFEDEVIKKVTKTPGHISGFRVAPKSSGLHLPVTTDID